MDGYVLFGFLTSVEPGPQPGQPNHWYQSLSLAASRWTGHPHRNVMLVGGDRVGAGAGVFLWRIARAPADPVRIDRLRGHLAADGPDRGSGRPPRST